MILPVGLLMPQIRLELFLLLALVQLVVECRLKILLIRTLIKNQILISVFCGVRLVAQERIYTLHLVNNQKIKF